MRLVQLSRRQVARFLGVFVILSVGLSFANIARADCCFYTSIPVGSTDPLAQRCTTTTATACPAQGSFNGIHISANCGNISLCTQTGISYTRGSCQTGSACLVDSLNILCASPSTFDQANACPQTTTANPGTGTSGTATAPKPNIVFDPEIKIPFFSGEAIDGTTFAKYVRAIFIGFIYAVGVLAVVMVIFGGVKWVAAAGNPARINDAREIVNNAIIGLVIALTSVVLLSLLDPKLVNFEGFSATTQLEVKPIPYETDIVGGKFDEGQTCKTKNGNPVQQESTCVVADKQMVWPVVGVTQTINSRVGPRDTGGVGSRCHPGTDFYTNKSTGHTIVAPHDGVVDNVTANVAGEYSMELHASNFYTKYIHVKQPKRINGQRVTKGELLGYSGGDPNDGKAIAAWSGGPHLHIELYTSDSELHDIVPCLQR